MAKVVPDRIYSVAVLPSSSSVVAAVGDRSGNLGIWNYSNQDSLDQNGVLAFSPHTATINALAFDPTNPSKLFSTAYDGTIRCLDIETSRFDLVYASEVREGGGSSTTENEILRETPFMICAGVRPFDC